MLLNTNDKLKFVFHCTVLKACTFNPLESKHCFTFGGIILPLNRKQFTFIVVFLCCWLVSKFMNVFNWHICNTTISRARNRVLSIQHPSFGYGYILVLMLTLGFEHGVCHFHIQCVIRWATGSRYPQTNIVIYHNHKLNITSLY